MPTVNTELPADLGAHRARFLTEGFVVLPGFVPPEACAAAVTRAQAIVAAFDPLAQAASRFSTRDRSLVADAALLASAHEVHCFFEEEALDAEGVLRVPKLQSVNKIGHALHVRDPFFADFSAAPALGRLAREVAGLARPEIWQSQLIFKQPRIGGEVGWHQDASFFFTTPHTVTTFWFALEEATLANGCLWVEPGGQRGPLREQYRCTDGRLSMCSLDPTPWPAAGDGLALPVPAGALVLFHGLLPHYSGPNRSERSRLAYTLHVTDAEAAYSPLNWLQAAPGSSPLAMVQASALEVQASPRVRA